MLVWSPIGYSYNNMHVNKTLLQNNAIKLAMHVASIIMTRIYSTLMHLKLSIF